MYELKLPNGAVFKEIVAPIVNIIKDYYWVFEEINCWTNSVDTEEETFVDKFYDRKSIIELTKGIVIEYIDFIHGDYDIFCGALDLKGKTGSVNFSKDLVEEWSNVLFTNTDGIYWEVYTTEKTIYNLLKQAFPDSTKPWNNYLDLFSDNK